MHQPPPTSSWDFNPPNSTIALSTSRSDLPRDPGVDAFLAVSASTSHHHHHHQLTKAGFKLLGMAPLVMAWRAELSVAHANAINTAALVLG